jgi:protein SCO1
MKSGKNLIILGIVWVLLAGTIDVILSKIHAHKSSDLPVLGHVDDFSLNQTTNKQFGLSDLEGKVWVACFFFTTCSDICPMMIKNMALLNQSFSSFEDVQLVSVTVNPEQDSPTVLGEYAKNNNLDQKKWHFLSGSRERITDLVVQSFKLGSKEEPIFHSAYFVLVDKKQNIRGYYEGTVKKNMQSIVRDVKKILEEK